MPSRNGIKASKVSTLDRDVKVWLSACNEVVKHPDTPSLRDKAPKIFSSRRIAERAARIYLPMASGGTP